MNISTIGSIDTYVKTMGMKVKWEHKKQTGDYTGDKKSLNEWESAVKTMNDKTDEDSEKNRLQAIHRKISSGKKLTVSEKSYLRDKDPVAYEKSVSIERERKSYERELRRCKTKEEVQRLKLSRMGSSLSTVNTVQNDSHIPTEKKLEYTMLENGRVAALEDATRKFIRRGDYGRFPTEAETAKAKKQLDETRDAIEELWEEIFREDPEEPEVPEEPAASEASAVQEEPAVQKEKAEEGPVIYDDPRLEKKPEQGKAEPEPDSPEIRKVRHARAQSSVSFLA